MRLVSRSSLANHLAWPIFGLTQDPSSWRAHLSAKVDSSEKDSGRLVISSLFRPLPNSPGFRRQHHVPHQDPNNSVVNQFFILNPSTVYVNILLNIWSVIMKNSSNMPKFSDFTSRDNLDESCGHSF